MKKRDIITFISICFLWNFTWTQNVSDTASGLVKISLRDAANQLLLSQGDSTSLILPIKELTRNRYQISFESEIEFEPTQIVETLKQSFQKATIQQDYLVEVKQCSDGEVAYSYAISLETEKTIVPCLDRQLPRQCYHIEVIFLHENTTFSGTNTLIIVLIVIVMIAMFYYAIIRRKQTVDSPQQEEYILIGGFLFYKDQNKLIKQPDEIVLSKKECELLEIFSENINSVVKREELTKKVWEDKGVIVGRSLDTYISKLRKKLQSDSSIRIINIHGVGYKLEVTETK